MRGKSNLGRVHPLFSHFLSPLFFSPSQKRAPFLVIHWLARVVCHAGHSRSRVYFSLAIRIFLLRCPRLLSERVAALLGLLVPDYEARIHCVLSSAVTAAAAVDNDFARDKPPERRE